MIMLAESEDPDQTDAKADLGLRCPHMPEDKFSHGASKLTTSLGRMANKR